MAVYLTYYAGNILYDLFLKKEKETYKEETEEFSLSEISEQYEDLTATIGIEDVENLNTPQSFNRNPIHSDYTEGNEERQDLEYLRELFESEQDLDEFDNPSKRILPKLKPNHILKMLNQVRSPLTRMKRHQPKRKIRNLTK
ncbi:Uncharacterised protein [Chryseobacterium carnipullorum]|uniref:Uncharacterized protein n=1 Tax=Chryseobacterium carnipullorum TaxID=1124835 RepID=A0A376DSE9_CHRCU|nr:Uncharacterised protein [Chryseobacterium carnipullorum]